MLTDSFGKAITADVKHVPLGLPCLSGNTQPVSLPCAVTPELTTSAEVLLTPGGYDSHCLAMSRSEHNTEGSVCGLVERSAEQEVILANGVDTATPFCDEDIARDAVGEEPNKEGEDNMWLGASLEPTHESDKEVGLEMLVQVEANLDLGYGEQASAGAAGGQAHVCSLGEDTASTFAKERRHGESVAGAHNAFDIALEAIASVPALEGSFSWSGKAIGDFPCREEDRDPLLVAVLSREHVPTPEIESAAERGSFVAVWTKETFGRWIFGIKVRIKTDDNPLTFLTRSAPLSASPTCQACKWQMW
ncbi:hypothetical protein HPB50_012464 [Hyalomma asiaticum]|uniref:Uncharacterized protein n=1 Tax=Hyalomma asiaticum TaxID=266040 RepID=A0ACB7RME2_HYAAI|nr:hypothetical protein HPB50_012464 [Hyalomma asiaticum]